ncbi:MAG: hypothetical protein H6730_38425 [Deltaproteobacteria bacterium]|nr:hypothetical protein [Deltaproteobacteria bacterium]
MLGRLQLTLALTLAPAVASAQEDPPPKTVTPAIGAPVIARSPPTWCEGATIAPTDSMMSSGTYSAMLGNSDRWSMVRRMAEHSCRAPDLESRQAWSQAWRQTIANHTGADSGLIERLFRFALAHDDSAIDAAKKAACAKVERTGPGPARVLGDSQAFALGCQENLLKSAPEIRIKEQLYWLDRGPEMQSELARAILIIAELAFDIDYMADDLGKHVMDRLPNHALVAHDLAVLDAAKLRDEVEALGTNEYGALHAELALARAQLLGRRYAALVEKMDPGVGKLTHASPTGYDAWVATFEAHEPAMRRALDLEDWIIAGKESQIKPCHDEAHAAFVAYAKPLVKGAQDLEQMKAALRDSFGRVLLEASLVCAAYEGKAAIASGLYLWELNEGEHQRGPRVASYAAMLARYATLASADSRFPVPATKLKRSFDFPSHTWFYTAYETRANNKAGAQNPQDGVIKSVKKGKNGVVLAFKTDRWMEPIFDCRPSKRIFYVTYSGNVHYHQDCKKTGQTPMSGKLKPVTVPASMASGLKAGQMVTLLVEENKARSALPLAVYGGKTKDKILGRLGVTK